MKSLKGTWILLKLALRNDRIKLPIIFFIIGLMAFSLPSIYDNLYETREDMFQAVMIFAQNPAARIFALPTGVSLGQYVILEVFVFFSIMVALMSSLAVVRHVRGNEETGRTELIGSTAVGRYSILASALLVALLANIFVAVLITLGFIINGLPITGSLITGVSIGFIGMSFASLAAVTSQLYESTRAANGMASLGLGITFLLSSSGAILGKLQESGVEVSPAWPIWLSPIGWGQIMKPFGNENWWPLTLFILLLLILTAIAFILTARRDIGLAILKSKPGPAKASRMLLSPIGLAWKLQQTLFIGWFVGISAMGLIWGTLSDQMIKIIEENPQFAEMLAGMNTNIQDLFISSILGFTAIIISIYTIQILLKIRTDEIKGITESVLATSISRYYWVISSIIVATLGSIILLLALGISSALGAGLAAEDLGMFILPYLKASLTQFSGIAVIIGITTFIIGTIPRWSIFLSWTILAVAVFFSPVIAPMFNLSETIQKISPFTHIPNVLTQSPDLEPIIYLFVISIVFLITGLINMRGRDLT